MCQRGIAARSSLFEGNSRCFRNELRCALNALRVNRSCLRKSGWRVSAQHSADTAGVVFVRKGAELVAEAAGPRVVTQPRCSALDQPSYVALHCQVIELIGKPSLQTEGAAFGCALAADGFGSILVLPLDTQQIGNPIEKVREMKWLWQEGIAASVQCLQARVVGGTG